MLSPKYAVSRLPNHLKGNPTSTPDGNTRYKTKKKKKKETDRLDSPSLYMNFGSPPLFIRAGHT